MYILMVQDFFATNWAIQLSRGFIAAIHVSTPGKKGFFKQAVFCCGKEAIMTECSS